MSRLNVLQVINSLTSIIEVQFVFWTLKVLYSIITPLSLGCPISQFYKLRMAVNQVNISLNIFMLVLMNVYVVVYISTNVYFILIKILQMFKSANGEWYFSLTFLKLTWVEHFLIVANVKLKIALYNYLKL